MPLSNDQQHDPAFGAQPYGSVRSIFTRKPRTRAIRRCQPAVEETQETKSEQEGNE